MYPSQNTQSAMHQQPTPSIASNFAASDELSASIFDLRGTLAEMIVRELSFSEFRAALEKFGTRYA
jgi:hypothetical protein